METLMNTEVLRDQLLQFFELQKASEIKDLLERLHPSVASEILEAFEPERIATALDLLDSRLRADLFGYLPEETQHKIARNLPEAALIDLIHYLSHDERVDFLNDFDDDKKEVLIKKLAQKEREDVRKLDAYDEGTVGALMTSDYVALQPGYNAGEAIAHLRQEAPDAETIYYAYILDEQRHVLGVVSLKQLILARPTRPVMDFAQRDVIALHTREPVENAVRALSKSDLLAMPVLDRQGKMVGIVTHDDVADTAEEESTEDFHRMGAVGGDLGTMSLRTAPALQIIWSRMPWLLALVFMNIFSGAGIAFFETTIEAVVSLVFFLPLLIGSGGNAGAQASTLMVRAMAIGDVKMSNWFSLLRKEIGIALVLGIAMGLAVALVASFRAPEVIVVVALTMVIVVLAGSLIGMSLPFVLSALKMDPATSSAPLVTSLADIAGVVIYFGIASWWFSLGADQLEAFVPF
jgi:magnesium transporter